MTQPRIFGSILVLLLSVAALPVAAQCDEDAPVLTAFDFDPKFVDVSGGDQLFTVTFDLTDDRSGIDLVGVEFVSPSLEQRVSCNADTPTAGTPTNGSYTCLVTVPRYSESGTWVVDSISLSDRVTRSGSLNTGELMAGGFPFELQVTSVPDIEAPMLTGLTLTPLAVDTSTGAQQVACDLTLTDNLAGTSVIFCSLESPSTEQRTNCAQLVPSSGTPTNGSYSCLINVPQYSESGDWAVSVQLSDVVDNNRDYTPGDLALAGFPDEIAVTSVPEDRDPPVLIDFDLQPQEVNVENADRTITCSAQLTDALSGTAVFGCSGTFIDLNFEVITQACASFTPDSGTRNNGNWSCDLTIPQYSPGGSWSFVTALWLDALGNSDFADPTVLQAGGFPSAFDVICGAAGPGPGPVVNWVNSSLLSWAPVAGALQYTIYGGPLALLVDGNGDGLPDAGYGSCRNFEDTNPTDTFFIDFIDPAPGTGNFILVGYDTVTEQDLGLGETSGMLGRSPTASCP